MAVNMVEPEQYVLSPTPHVPNSRLPVLVYRNALTDTTTRNILNTIEPNGWIKGGQWKAYTVPHFHTQCHECYGIIKGGSTYVLGVSPSDPEVDDQGRPYGMKLKVEQGDVFVLPAGVCHFSVDSWGDYEFIGLYPNGILNSTSHRFDMNYGFKPTGETAALITQSEAVGVPPLDPLYGLNGPLPRLWIEAARGSSIRARI
ncbi:cupin domain-containing protein [Aspergillus stella-maris]|uniref:cupin domain-containing protein n=1 Tax=Aspergillus stella-maris TaxID=1810926 RepID=UPI003CCCD406